MISEPIFGWKITISILFLVLLGSTLAFYLGRSSALVGFLLGVILGGTNFYLSAYLLFRLVKESAMRARLAVFFGFLLRLILLGAILFGAIKILQLNIGVTLIAFLIAHTILLFILLGNYSSLNQIFHRWGGINP